MAPSSPLPLPVATAPSIARRGRRPRNPELSPEQRKAERSIKNRESAKRSRLREKEREREIADRLRDREHRRQALAAEVTALRSHLNHLQLALHRLAPPHPPPTPTASPPTLLPPPPTTPAARNNTSPSLATDDVMDVPRPASPQGSAEDSATVTTASASTVETASEERCAASPVSVPSAVHVQGTPVQQHVAYAPRMDLPPPAMAPAPMYQVARSPGFPIHGPTGQPHVMLMGSNTHPALSMYFVV